MTTRSVLWLSISLGLCATACPESKTETSPEPKSPAEAVEDKAVEAKTGAAGSGAKANEGEEKNDEGGW